MAPAPRVGVNNQTRAPRPAPLPRTATVDRDRDRAGAVLGWRSGVLLSLSIAGLHYRYVPLSVQSTDTEYSTLHSANENSSAPIKVARPFLSP